MAFPFFFPFFFPFSCLCLCLSLFLSFFRQFALALLQGHLFFNEVWLAAPHAVDEVEDDVESVFGVTAA